MRSPFDLAALTPEAKNVGGDEGFILGGGQAGGYTATLDGVSENTCRALSDELALDQRAIARGHRRVHRRYERLQGRIRPFERRCHDLRHQVRNQRLHGNAYEFLRNTDSGRELLLQQQERYRSPDL